MVDGGSWCQAPPRLQAGVGWEFPMPSPPPLLEAVVFERLRQASPPLLRLSSGGVAMHWGVLQRFVASNADWAA